MGLILSNAYDKLMSRKLSLDVREKKLIVKFQLRALELENLSSKPMKAHHPS